MLRLAVPGVAPDDLQGIARRLRSVIVESCRSADSSDPVWESADAVACFETAVPVLEFVARSLQARKHVLVAARAGLAIDQLDRLSAIACEQGVTLAVENPDHALPSRRLIRQQIENGKLGEVGVVRIMRGEWAPENDRAPQELPESHIGDLELAVWLVGRAPDTVYAVRRPVASAHAPGGTHIQSHLGFPHGGMALVTWTNAWPAGEPHHGLSVIAASGAAYSDEHQNRQLLFGGGPATAPRSDEGSVAAALLQTFADRVSHVADRDDNLDAWRRLSRVVAAVERSAATGQAVSLKGD